MRLVGDFSEEIQAIEFMSLLQSHNITSLIDQDNGLFCVWVHDEGHIKRARKLLEDFKEGKRAFYKKKEQVQQTRSKELPQSDPVMTPYGQGENKSSKESVKQPPKTFMYQPLITRALLLLCVLVYIIATIQRFSHDDIKAGSGFYPPIAKELFMDYPKSFEIRDELVKKYGLENVRDNKLPEEAKPLVEEFGKNPPWIGVYNIMLTPKDAHKALWKGQFLEKVRHGQVWRLFTPVILHIGLLHFLFNMLWLVVLGKMVEYNMGRVRFVLFILATGVFSNFCQYVMTGPFFLGISGVLSAFIGYIWVRKKCAPWEVYFIRKETLYFFLCFILGFLALQIGAFVLQYLHIYSIPIPIANTGHISGLLAGMFLAKTNWMSKKPA